MRLSQFLLASLALVGKVVDAGALARGPEALYMYYAYRMDVEVSVAEAEKEGKTRAEILKDPPWKMASGASADLNEADDWPSGKKDTSKYGLNFHAFCKYANNQGYGRDVGREKVADPWKPTLEEVKGIARWAYDEGSGQKLATDKEIEDDLKKNPDPKKSKIPGNKLTSFNGFSPKKLFKGLPTGDWSKQLGVVAELASERFKKNPDVAGPHFDKMIEATKEAQVARKLDSGDFQKTRVWQMVESWIQLQDKNPYSKNIVKSMIKEKSVTIQESQSSVYAGEPYKNVDPSGTMKALQNTFGKDKMQHEFFQDLITFLKGMAQDFETAKTNLAEKAGGPNGNKSVQKKILVIDNSHQKVMGQLKVLNDEMTTQRNTGGGDQPGC